VKHEIAAVPVCSMYTIQPCSSLRHFMQSHIRRVQVCLAVTCYLHFWQNDRDLLHATAVTQGWNGYQNNRIIVSTESWPAWWRNLACHSCQDSNLGTIRSWIWRTYHWAVPSSGCSLVGSPFPDLFVKNWCLKVGKKVTMSAAILHPAACVDDIINMASMYGKNIKHVTS